MLCHVIYFGSGPFRKICSLERQTWRQKKTNMTHEETRSCCAGSESCCRGGDVQSGTVRDYLAGTDCAFKQITGWAEQRARVRTARALPCVLLRLLVMVQSVSRTATHRMGPKSSNYFRSLSNKRVKRSQWQPKGKKTHFQNKSFECRVSGRAVITTTVWVN